MTPLHAARLPQADHILLRTYAFMSWQQDTVNFLDHPLLLQVPLSDPKFVRLAYGTNSASECRPLAYARARELGTTDFSLRLEFKLRGSLSKALITKESMQTNGFVHVRRLKKTYREELRDEVLASLEPGVLAVLEGASLDDILALHPQAACTLMHEHPEIDVLVHAAAVNFGSGHGPRKIQVAMVRTEQARRMGAHVQCLEGIPVRVGH